MAWFTVKRAMSDRRGTTAIVFALSAIPVIGIVGAAVDFARAVNVQSRMQYALDSAVLAAADTDDMTAARIAQQYFTANFANGGAVGAGTIKTTFSRDPSGNMTGSATVDVPMTIMQVLNFDKVTVETSATAKPIATTTATETQTVTQTVVVPGSVPCFHIMDQSGSRTLTLQNNTNLDARNCEIHVRSNSGDAILTENENNVKWKKLLVKGSGGSTWGLLDTIMSAPNRIQYDSAIVADPYTRPVSDVIATISVGSCTTANTGKSYVGTTVNPGTYCGSTTFDGVIFNPGLYIIASGTGSKTGLLTLKGLLDGSKGVSFYFADAKAQLLSYTATNGTMLSAPTTGNTRGLLFFENSNRGNTWDLSISDMTNHRWNGVVYWPSGNVSMNKWSTTAGGSMAFALIVNRLKITNWTGVTNLYAWTPFNASAPLNLPETTTTSTTTQNITVTTTKDGWLMR